MLHNSLLFFGCRRKTHELFRFQSSNITGQFVEAGIHRLRTTIHLVRIIDDTLGYLRPRCPIQFPYLQGSSILSSQLYYYLLSRRYPNYKNHIAEQKKKDRDLKVSFQVSTILRGVFNEKLIIFI